MAKKKEKPAPEVVPDLEVSYIEACTALAETDDFSGLIRWVDPERSTYHSQHNWWMLRNDRGGLIARVGFEQGELVVLRD